ncbi:TPA: mersacidin family lantibiotic [Bacillus nitratireducens]|uniref:Mersacidin family lantibiotic n=2 Tax=Bacillus TaxID=1386 RepID=A0ABU5JWQ7_9BACI|nr:type 2 lantibiotic [Bacillus cereus VDM062]MDZ5607868.1 mersacidin family lantibiotic [Bacillus pseudomycoides]
MMKEMTNYAGPSFEELEQEEMELVQGSGDVQAETTPVCFTVGLGVGSLVSASVC